MALDGAYADTMGATADASSEALTAFALATGHRPAADANACDQSRNRPLDSAAR